MLVMKHAMKHNGDTRKALDAAKSTAFKDMTEYYAQFDKQVIRCSVKQLNEYFMNLIYS